MRQTIQPRPAGRQQYYRNKGPIHPLAIPFCEWLGCPNGHRDRRAGWSVSKPFKLRFSRTKSQTEWVEDTFPHMTILLQDGSRTVAHIPLWLGSKDQRNKWKLGLGLSLFKIPLLNLPNPWAVYPGKPTFIVCHRYESCWLWIRSWPLLIEHRNPSTPGVWKQQESALGLLKMFFSIDIFKVQFYSSFVFTWCSVGQLKGHFVVVCHPHLMYFFYLRQYASPWHSHFCNFIPTGHKVQTATASNQYWILP